MPIITIASPDKISMSLFISFSKFSFKDLKIGGLQSLMSKENISLYVDDFVKNSNDILFTYYAKRCINVDPFKIIPEKLITISDLVVWMNMYAVEWLVLKDTQNLVPILKPRWDRNIKKMDVEPVSF